MIFLFIGPLPAHTKVGSKEPQSAYAQMLDTLRSDTPHQQLQRLQNFVRAHPEDERAYFKLLECYQVRQTPAEARAFFQHWQHEQKGHRNAIWMLAKIAACDSLSQAQQEALAAFANALRDSLVSPSPRLVYDFVTFCHHHADDLDPASLIRQYLIRPTDRVLAFGFQDYLNQNFKAAEQILTDALRVNPDSPLLFYILSDCILHNELRPAILRQARADSVSRHGLYLAQQNQEPEWQARFGASLGDIAYERNAYEQAQASYDQAYKIAQASQEVYSLQRVLAGMGKLQYVQNHYAEADTLYRQAIALATQICAYRELSLLYSNRCHLLNVLGNFSQALRAGTASERYARRAHDEEGLVRIKLKLARLYYDLLQDQYAKQLCTQVHALAQQKGYKKMYYRASAQLGDISAREKKFVRARQFYDDYLAYLKDAGINLERHSYIAKKADTYKEEGAQHYDQAIALYWQAQQEAAREHSDYYQAWYLLEIADLETKRGRFDQAQQALAAISVDAFNESAEGVIRFKLGWGQYFEKRGAWDQAIAAYLAASAVIDSARPKLTLDRLRISYFSDRARAAQGLAECYYQRYLVRQATADRDSLFHYLESAEGHSFQDLFDQNDLSATNNTDSAATRAYQSACKDLQRLQRQLRLAPSKHDSLRTQYEVARYSVVYQRPQVQARRQTLFEESRGGMHSFAKAQKILRQMNAALLLYHLAEDAPFVLAVSATDFRALPLRTTRAEITALCDSLMAPFRSDTLRANLVERLAFRAGLAHQLYKLLVKPAEEAMTLPQQLIIVPDAALTSVPFEMFLTKAQLQAVYLPTDSTVYAQDFLLQRYDIAYSPSFDLIKQNLQTRSPAQGVLLLANPLQQTIVLPGDTSAGMRERVLAPLPYTELEAERIQQISSHTVKYTRAQATEQVFLREAAQQRVVHFATHAFVDSVFDDFSGLVLALTEDSSDDGFLMGYEITDQTLANDLVALSACETGRGKVADGEGVLGLPRLFLRAGAKSVLMTLWQVDDQFAAELLPHFYQHYFNEGRSKVAALAEAKRDLLRDAKPTYGLYQQHPFYWAAFTLYGDPGQNRVSFISLRLVPILSAIVLILVALFFYFRYRIRKAISHGSQSFA